MPVIVVGEVAGALQGWPLVLSGAGVVEVCGGADTVGAVLTNAGFAERDGSYVLPAGQSITLVAQPPGTYGRADLIRGADAIPVGSGTVNVASVVDLLRIAEASAAGERRREALAYQALLDVRRAQQNRSASSRRSASERRQRLAS